jgi:hypothetical protein
MKSRHVMAAAVGFLMLALATVAHAQEQKALGKTQEATQGREVQAGDQKISGPYTHGNLTIFLVHGKDTIPGKQFLTLQEALEQKKVIVHETKNVNELSVENVSSDVEVFIQAGDIVKGGQQDRVLSYDLIVSAKSGKVPIPSFCVEAGRWQGRAGEATEKFDAAPSKAAGKDLKLAVNYSRNQQRVWRQVAEQQMRLSENLGTQVKSSTSESSLQLSLENKKLIEAAMKYEKDLAKVLEEKKDVIGYAYAVNGKVEGADIYGSAALFRKVWPQLLRANAVEAVAELKKDKKFEPPTSDAVKAFFADTAQGKNAEDKAVTKRVQVVTKETAKNLLLQTRDKQQKGAMIHASYIAK